jgi:hypothetical protein
MAQLHEAVVRANGLKDTTDDALREVAGTQQTEVGSQESEVRSQK